MTPGYGVVEVLCAIGVSKCCPWIREGSTDSIKISQIPGFDPSEK